MMMEVVELTSTVVVSLAWERDRSELLLEIDHQTLCLQIEEELMQL
jgi:hypothetical protein